MTHIKNLLCLVPSIFLALTLVFPTVSSDGLYFALVAPITKDTNTSLYSITLNLLNDLDRSREEYYVMDLGGSGLWYLQCPLDYPLFDCPSSECSQAQSYTSPSCPPIQNQCPCTVTTVNPLTGTCVSSQLAYKPIAIFWTNGLNPAFTMTYARSVVSCAPPTLMTSLPVGSSGVAGFSRLPHALPAQFFLSFLEFKNHFAICLPSSDAAPGVFFFGNGPYYLGPPESVVEIDATSTLSYTPLLKHPINPKYYIDLKGIYVGGKPCQFPIQMVELDSIGQGGVTLSTINPYTILKSQIYSNFVKQFARATDGIPRAQKVKPFDLCLEMKTNTIGFRVPQIDLELANGVNLTIYGSNSMKQVSSDVACLAFIDGGKKLEEAIVIGSYQMENTLFLFDLEESKLGFTPPLLDFGTTCSEFNFTVVF